MVANSPWNPWTHFPMALSEWIMVATIPLASYWVLSFVGKSSKSSHILPHPLSSWANSRTSWGMWWCALHHHGSQGAHHDIPSKAHPLTSLLEHRIDFAYSIIVNFANGSGTWSPFGCFASFPWQAHHGDSQVELPFGTLFVATLLWPSVGVKPNTWKKWGFGVLWDSRMFRAR
jgi:hypothetical protein